MQTPKEGKVTFDSEGTEGGYFHSRKLHVPTASSGLTLGRGYDMRFKSSLKIKNDLIKANITKNEAELLSQASGLFGQRAKDFIKKNKLEKFEITSNAQLKLFEITYKDEELETKRLCTKTDVEGKYGKCDWENLNLAIKEILVDLKFRGDYHSKAREKIQKIVSENNFEDFLKKISDKSIWKNVPQDRFDRRVKYFKENYNSK